MDIVTACTLDCPDACSLLVKTLADGTIRIKGNPNHPVTAGFTCAKIRRFGQRLRSEHRITTPLLRQGEDWKAIGWEEALHLCAEKIQQYRVEPESILHLRGEGDKGVLSQASKLFFAELGSSQVAGCLCDVAGISSIRRSCRKSTSRCHSFGSRRKIMQPAGWIWAKMYIWFHPLAG